MNALITKMSPTATRMIRRDHRAVVAQFHKLEPSLSTSAREAVVRTLCNALEIHAQLEEEIFYPALRNAGIELPALERSGPEHDEMRGLIDKVRSSEHDLPAQSEALNQLMRTVLHHVAEEETVLLPAAESMLGSQLGELGARMGARRLQLARPKMGRMAADMARASPARTALMVAGTLAAGALLVGRLRRGDHPNGQARLG